MLDRAVEGGNPVLEQKALAAIGREEMLRPGDGVLAAVSGGADSMALLHVLTRLAPAQGWRVAAAHVHHGLRGAEADRDEEFVRRQCAALGVPLFVCHADVRREAEQSGEGLEEAGRRVRYAYLARVCRENGLRRTATAHTASDNLETLLLHLARGCAVRGLCGIRPVLGDCIRPLLDCSRGEIEAYCRERGIPYVTDGTNLDPAFSRNRIRLEAVPALRAVNPRLEEAAARLVRAAARDEAYLEEQAGALLKKARRADGAAACGVLEAAPAALRLRALERLTGGAEERHLLAAQRLLTQEGALTLPGGRRLRAADGWLILEDGAPAEEVPYFEIPLQPGDTCEICGRNYRLECLSLAEFEKKKKIHKNLLKKTMNYDKIIGNLTVRQRLPGDRYHPVGRQGGKTLKKLCNEAKIPPAERASIPVLCDEAGILLAGEFGVDRRAAADGETSVCLVFYEVTA